jgi:hypothetical protein
MLGDKQVDKAGTLAAMDAGPASHRIGGKYGETSWNQNRVQYLWYRPLVRLPKPIHQNLNSHQNIAKNPIDNKVRFRYLDSTHEKMNSSVNESKTMGVYCSDRRIPLPPEFSEGPGSPV